VGELLDLARVTTANDFLLKVEKIFQVRVDKDLGEVLMEARESLETQLTVAEEAHDPALFLHVFVLLIFSLLNKSLLSATGKFVPQIINHLKKGVGDDEFTKIRTAQDSVIQHIKGKGTQGQVDSIYGELKALLNTVNKTRPT